jgi:sigma-B regulation protein RsbU (phosphoserine phosphatase)
LNPAACPTSNCLRHRSGLAFLAALAWLSLALMPNGLASQTLDATDLRQPTDLAATWLVRGRDDPDYARPDFDDSRWMKFDPTKDLHEVFPHGHPEIVWYRLHMKVAPAQTDMAVLEQQMRGAFELYSNGVLLIHGGRIVPYVSYNRDALLMAPIPDGQGSIMLALRVYIPATDWVLPRPGLQSNCFTIGQIGALREHMWYGAFSSHALEWLDDLVGLGMLLGALLLYSTQRNLREYLWLFLLQLVGLPSMFFSLLGLFHTYPTWWILLDVGALGTYFQGRMYCAFVRHRIGWRLTFCLAVACIGLEYQAVAFSFGSLSQVGSVISTWPVEVVQFLILPLILITGIRRGNREAGFLLLPLLITGVSGFCTILFRTLALIPEFRDRGWQLFFLFWGTSLGPITIRYEIAADVLSMFSLALIILIRSNRVSRQQSIFESELAAAREVQRVLVPEQIASIPGFAVESVYQPAQQVGGDFFQILPDGEGGLLVVVGDVAGKGLPAAMLVSVLVGAIRATAEFSKDPAELLGHLNERLIGRTNGGFSTTLAARVSADGSVLLANAGHLPPYLDGCEVELPGALPLGVLKGASYEATRFNLAQGSRLTFYTDGVVEAQNQKGELFGFERGRSVSTRPAVAIVEEAKQFGQSDDITVVTLERLVAVEDAAASRTAPSLATARESMTSDPLA